MKQVVSFREWSAAGMTEIPVALFLCAAPCRGSMPQKRRMGVYAPLRSVLNVYHWHTAPQRVGEDGSSLLDLEHRKDRMV